MERKKEKEKERLGWTTNNEEVRKKGGWVCTWNFAWLRSVCPSNTEKRATLPVSSSSDLLDYAQGDSGFFLQGTKPPPLPTLHDASGGALRLVSWFAGSSEGEAVRKAAHAPLVNGVSLRPLKGEFCPVVLHLGWYAIASAGSCVGRFGGCGFRRGKRTEMPFSSVFMPFRPCSLRGCPVGPVECIGALKWGIYDENINSCIRKIIGRSVEYNKITYNHLRI